MVTFWRWFKFGSGARPGYRRIINKWFIIHLVIGTIVAVIVKEPLSQAANTVLFPLSSVFVGLAFAWSANIHGLLNTKEISLIIKQKNGGIYEYIYVVQISILLIMTTLVFWGLAGLKVYDNPIITFPHGAVASKIFLYTLASFSIHECWHIIYYVQLIFLVSKQIERAKENNKRSQFKKLYDFL